MLRLAGITLLLLALTACGDERPAVIEGRPAGPYRLTLDLDPARPQVGAETRLTFRLTHARSGKPVTGLDVLHERVIHNFIVALDFSSFAHIHHEDFRPISATELAAARFSFPYRFPTPGRFRIVSEFTHRGRGYIQHFDLGVGTPAPAAPRTAIVRLVRQVGDYRGTLHLSPTVPVAGFETELVLELDRAGVPVTDLELLLGSEVHVAVWRDDGAEFGHTHSFTPHMAQMLAAMHDRDLDAQARARRLADMMVQMMHMPPELIFRGPRVPVHYVFPAPGLYHVFLQCAPRGEPRVFDFTVEVVGYQPGMDTHVDSMPEERAAR